MHKLTGGDSVCKHQDEEKSLLLLWCIYIFFMTRTFFFPHRLRATETSASFMKAGFWQNIVKST